MREPLPDEARDAIRARIYELGYSQPQAAKAAGVSITTLNAALRGRSNPQPLQRAALCKLLGWTADSIDRLEAGEPAVVVDTVAAPRVAHVPVPVAAPVDDDDAAVRATLDERIRRLEAVVQHLAGEQAVREWGNGKPAGR